MKTLLSVIAIAALFAAAGCTRGSYTPGTYPAGKTSMEHSSKIIYADNLTYKIYVVNLNSTPAEDGRLKVYAELENRTGKNLVIQVQTQFRDITGNDTPDMTNWRTIVMAPHSSTSYDAISLNNQAKDYVVRVKLEDRH